MVGLGVDFDDVGDYVARQRPRRRRALLRALHRSGLRRPARAGQQHGRVRRGPRTAAPPTVRAARRHARAAATSTPVASSRRAPPAASDLRAEPVPEDAPLDPRNVYAATKLHQEHLCRAYAREHPGATVTALRYHNVYGAADAPRHALRRGGQHLPQRARAGRPPRCSRTAASGGTSSHVARRRPGQRARADARRAGRRRRSTWPAGEPHTVLDMAVGPRRRHGRARPRGGRRAPPGRRPPRVRLSRPRPATALGFRPRSTSTTAWPSSPPPPCAERAPSSGPSGAGRPVTSPAEPGRGRAPGRRPPRLRRPRCRPSGPADRSWPP